MMFKTQLINLKIYAKKSINSEYSSDQTTFRNTLK